MENMTVNSFMELKMAINEPYSILICALFVLAIFVAFLIAMFKSCENKAQLKARIMRSEGLSPKSAQRMANLIERRQWIFQRSLHSADRRRNWTSMDQFLQHEFCTLMRWANRIEAAKVAPNSDQYFGEMSKIADEMRLHANSFELQNKIKRELTNVTRLSENSLQKYEIDFIGSVL